MCLYPEHIKVDFRNSKKWGIFNSGRAKFYGESKIFYCKGKERIGSTGVYFNVSRGISYASS
jgi:hypothetical protein